MKEKKNYIILMVIMVIVGAVIYIFNRNNPTEVEQFVAANMNKNHLSESNEQAVDIYVQVSGEVLKPGVYQLKSGSRVFEAVALAGGTTTGAALAVVNQAQLLEDGDQIHFPKQSEEDDQGDSLININTATLEELQSITGIGEAKAQSIIDYRTEVGPFKAIEDLMLVEGIKEGLFANIEAFITIY